MEAIDQSDIKTSRTPLERHVDLPAVVAVLNGRTARRIREIDAAYQSFEHRSLRTDVLGYGESGFPTDLTLDGIARVRVLLDRDRWPNEGDLAAGLAEMNRLDADAAELHSLLMNDLDDLAIERVMTLLRHDAPGNEALARHYSVVAGSQPTGRDQVAPKLSTDLGRLGIRNMPHAMFLYFGQTLSADQLKVADLRGRIESVDTSITKLQQPQAGPASIFEAQVVPAFVIDAEVGELKKKRSGLVAEMEAFVAQTGAEGRKESLDQADAADPEAAMAAADKGAKERMGAVMGSDAELTSAGIVGADAQALRSLVADDPVGSASAHLLQLREIGDLNATAITDVFREFEQAEVQARRALPMESPDVVEKTAQSLASDYTRRLPGVYDAARPPGTPTFDVLATTGSDGDISYNATLLVHGGRLDPVQELRFALAGSRHDLETVKRVLRDKSAAEIADIKREFPELETELFGRAPTTAGDDNDVIAALAAMTNTGGKASRSDRLILEDYLQRPSAEGGPAGEGRYIQDRAEREYQYAINRGFTGWSHDRWGSRAGLDGRVNHEHPAALLTVRDRRRHRHHAAAGDAAVAGHDPRRPCRLREGQCRAPCHFRGGSRVRAASGPDRIAHPGGCRSVFRVAEGAEAATMAARAVKVIRGVLVNTVATVGANATVHDNYGTAALKHDLLGGLGSLLGAGAVGKLSGVLGKPFVTSLAGKEIVSAASTVAGVEATALLEGSSLTGDLSVRNFLIMHGQGKVMHAVGQAFAP